MCEETARLCGAQVTSSTAKVSQCVHKYKFLLIIIQAGTQRPMRFPGRKEQATTMGTRGLFSGSETPSFLVLLSPLAKHRWGERLEDAPAHIHS